ncbi:MAG: transaldolase family protein, partial [Acetobacteraceae bacterium]
MTNPLAQLSSHGQSVWLDFLSRSLVGEGELKRLIERDDVRGVTSNPSIFEKAIGHSKEYDSDIASFLKAGDRDIDTMYQHLVVADIQHAADVLRPIYDELEGSDGFVSLEVSPYLAMSTEDTTLEARKLWSAVQRPNLMVKVPGTKPGVPAIRTLIGEGININVTLLFGIAAYEAVANAYMEGLETALSKGRDIS